jgi:hypothetical protein
MIKNQISRGNLISLFSGHSTILTISSPQSYFDMFKSIQVEQLRNR